VPSTLSVVPQLGTTNDGGGTTSPAEAKIIVGGPRTCCGWGGNAGKAKEILDKGTGRSLYAH